MPNNKNVIHIGTELFLKRFLPTHLQLSSRLVSYWRKMNMLPFMPKDKKGFMDMSEALWLLIINELMRVGISARKAQNLSEKVWLEPFYNHYADKTLNWYISSPFSDLNADQKASIAASVNDEFLMHSLLRRQINPFTDAVKGCLKPNRKLVSLVYNPNSEEVIFSESGTLLNDLNNFYHMNTLITIPFLPLLAKLIGIEIEKFRTDLSYLNNVENQIRRTVVFDKPKLLEIELFENGSRKIWKVTEQHKKGEEIAKLFLENKFRPGSEITIVPRSQGNYKITVKS